MDSKKIFFILLIVLAVLYFASLGTGIALNKSGDNDGQPRDLSEATDQWIGALGPLLSVFAPALDLSDLTCNGQPVKRRFMLKLGLEKGNDDTKTHTCDITIPPDDDRDYRKAKLITEQASVVVYVRAEFEEERFHPKDRKENCLLDKSTLSDKMLNFRDTKDPERPLVTEEFPSGPRLEVLYQRPEEEDGNNNEDEEDKPEMWECWLKQDEVEAVPITAFKGGGTLRLTVACDDCKKKPRNRRPRDEEESVVVTLRME